MTNKENRVAVYALKLDTSVNEQHFQYLLAKTSERIKQKMQKYRHKIDAYRSLFAESLAKYCIGQYTCIPCQGVVFQYLANGKPYVELDHVHFNISHSGNWVVCAVSHKPVGVDIEQQLPNDLNDVAGFFSLQEQQDLFNRPKQEQLEYFYSLWTLKESFIKQTGEGFSRDLNSYSIQLNGGTIELCIEQKLHDPVYFKQYDIAPDYKMVVCAAVNDFAELKEITLKQIVSYF
ncbi:MAG: 4'-phosphopantetheinyl transferase superfamily protein [Sphingobacteriales bacterium]|nr:MAG: 4'-phosphopantetheinyl transferase superfamily protein [Sphingobacteriales bacterium]